jgi:hypothetical protein
VARGFARFHAAGNVDGARKQQQFFRQRGFTRIGVRNDGESAPAARLVGKRHESSKQKRCTSLAISLALQTKKAQL